MGLLNTNALRVTLEDGGDRDGDREEGKMVHQTMQSSRWER